MNGMTWKGLSDLAKNLNDLALSVVLPKIAVPIFFVFSLLALLIFFFPKADYINKYFNDKKTIIVSCIILTVLVFPIFEIEFDFIKPIIVFIFMFGLLRSLTQLFFNI
jgi:hypothetical protein